MFKKIFLTIVFCLISYEISPIFKKEDSYLNNPVTVAVAGIGAVGTAVYWMQRETNTSIVTRSKNLISESYKLVDQSERYFYGQSKAADECASVLLEDELLVIKEKVDDLYNIVHRRYGNYLTFWNWTDQMKETVQEFKKLSKKINENLYAFSLKKAFSFVQKYQQQVHSKTEFFADNKNLNDLFAQTKTLNRDLSEISKKGKFIKIELLGRASLLDSVDKKIVLDLDEILNKIDFMLIVLKYSDCLLSVDNLEMLIRNVRKTAGASSSYPIKDFVSVLTSDIQSLKKLENHFELYVVNGIELLQNLLAELVSTQEYSKERQMYEIYLEEQRKARAAEAQARAAQDRAYAEHRQADALKEQNRIQKERNRIERERNQIEKNKKDF